MIKLRKKVTVLMPVYNGELHIKEAIESILRQTYKDFDLLIIDDGSTDNTVNVIKSYNDSRIVLLKNEKNSGIVYTLNRGLDCIDSTYIARMDADDIAYPERLEKQVQYMEENKEIAVSGTSVLVFDEKGHQNKLIVRSDSSELRTELLFKSPLMHPTVIMRNWMLKEANLKYDEKHIATEDYGLWQNISKKYELGNLKEVLLKYRDNNLGISNIARKKVDERNNMHILLHREFLDTKLKLSLTEEELLLWRKFNIAEVPLNDIKTVQRLAALIKKIRNKLNEEDFSLSFFDNRVSLRYRMNASSSDLNILATFNLYKKELSSSFNFDNIEKAKFVVKSLYKK